MSAPRPNTRLKLAAPVVCGTIAFVIIPVRRRSLGAFRAAARRGSVFHLALPSDVTSRWLLFVVGAIPATILWVRIASVVRSKGFPFPWLNIHALTALRHFHSIMRDEPNPEQKATYRRLVVAMYVCYAWCLFWFVAFVLA